MQKYTETRTSMREVSRDQFQQRLQRALGAAADLQLDTPSDDLVALMLGSAETD